MAAYERLVVMLLPPRHGRPGTGTLQCQIGKISYVGADFNIIATNVTTPASYFHLLRRQLAMPFRKPIGTHVTKSLLRHPKCVSSIKILSLKWFQTVIDDTTVKKADRILFCSGKIYYELDGILGEKNNIDNVAIVRVEQLFPFQKKDERHHPKTQGSRSVVGTGKKSANMGAWNYMLNYLEEINGSSSQKAECITGNGL